MSLHLNDPLLLFGKGLALFFQGLFALLGIAAIIIIPAVLLASQDMLPESFDVDLPIIDASATSVLVIAILLLIIAAAMIMFFGKLRAIIRTVGDGDPFIPDNAQRLNTMAWLLLGVQVAGLFVGALRLYLANAVATTADARESLDLGINDFEGLIMALILFILARVFRHGAAMRADLEGTV